MKQKIRQIFFDMRHQPIIAWVTLIATAMSIFLIMVVVIVQRVKVIPFPPESCRDRMMVGDYLHVKSQEGGEMSSGISYQGAKELYEGLDGVERVSYMSSWLSMSDVSGTTGETFSAIPRCVDSEFFKIFDHQLVAGRYFTPEETAADLPLVILSEGTARRAFGTAECIGEKLFYNYSDYYTVVGVVKDHSLLARTGSGEIFINAGPTNTNLSNSPGGHPVNQWFGGTSAVLLLKEGVEYRHIRDQVKARYAALNSKLAETGFEAIYHEAPYEQEIIAAGHLWSNASPDMESGNKMTYLLYAILLLVPAINLSGMLHSRMRRRVSEIGVRRAFGCTRRRIISDIIAENFIFTLIGGIVGLLLGLIFATTYNGLYDSVNIFGSGTSGATPPLSAILNWGTILIAMCTCFLLNLISAAVPAWQASRLSVVNAINAK